MLHTINPVIRIGTRGSLLAITQAKIIKKALSTSGHFCELVTITTKGDQNQYTTTNIGSGIFTTALREALHHKRVDIAVHSYKDLPTDDDSRFKIAAIPTRANPHDVLVARNRMLFNDLPAGSVVGTSSARRAAQLRILDLNLEICPIRGNLDTRLSKVTNGDFDAIVVAYAGLDRIGKLNEVTEVFDLNKILPAPAQGALAVECRSDDKGLISLLLDLDDINTRLAVTAERVLLAKLGAGCSAPIGAIAEIVKSIDKNGNDFEELLLRSCVATLDGSNIIHASGTGSPDKATELGISVALKLSELGVNELLVERGSE